MLTSARAKALVGLLGGSRRGERRAARRLDQAAQRRLLLKAATGLSPLGERARLARVKHQNRLLGQDAGEPGLKLVLADGVAHE